MEEVLERYLEFKIAVQKVIIATIQNIDTEALKIEKTDMPYRNQFILEEVIKGLQRFL